MHIGLLALNIGLWDGKKGDAPPATPKFDAYLKARLDGQNKDVAIVIVNMKP